MTDEINFCPFCNAAQHKLAAVSESMMFCRECNRFFRFEHAVFPCPKCKSKRIKDSEFPSPDGQLVFQCQTCKRMFPAKDFFRKSED